MKFLSSETLILRIMRKSNTPLQNGFVLFRIVHYLYGWASNVHMLLNNIVKDFIFNCWHLKPTGRIITIPCFYKSVREYDIIMDKQVWATKRSIDSLSKNQIKHMPWKLMLHEIGFLHPKDVRSEYYRECVTQYVKHKWKDNRDFNFDKYCIEKSR